MDAAIAGLIGSLGGVIVGAAAQAAQAARSRKWQVADQDRTTAEQQEARLWQERRIAYSAFMDAEMDATQKVNWAWLINAAEPSPEERSAHPVSQAAMEAMQLATEAISRVTRLSQEVLLITGSDAVSQAVSSYKASLSDFEPRAAHRGNPDRSEQGQTLLLRMTQSHALFVAAARDELGVAGPSRGRQRTLDDDQR